MINQKLTAYEDEFSFTLGEGSRWLERVVLKLLFATALTVETTGLFLAIRMQGDKEGTRECRVLGYFLTARDVRS
jgi:hypothetical protein